MFHIDADYLPVRADVAPPHWTRETLIQAEELVCVLQEIHKPGNPNRSLQNIRIRGDYPNA